jgi:peptide/nickel transport system permease protein
VRRGRLSDRLITLGLFLLYSIPGFVAAMLLLQFLCYGDFLKIFPFAGLHSEAWQEFSRLGQLGDYLWHIFLPVVCLSIFSLAGLAMYARTSMLDVIHQDYMRTARAKGVAEHWVIFKHGMRNALIPVITLFAHFLPAMLGGSVLIEWLFNIPGMGRLSFQAIYEKDITTLMALTYIDAIIVLLSVLLSDIFYVIADPRITFVGVEAA